MKHILFSVIWMLIPLHLIATAGPLAPDYSTEIAPLLTKYCAGCHNAEEANGELSLQDFTSLEKGGESGPAMTPGSAASSRMLQMVLGKLEPVMPPDDEPHPSAAEIKLLATWIDAGAPGPNTTAETSNAETSAASQAANLAVTQLAMRTARIAPPVDLRRPITAVAFAPGGERLAIARFGLIELLSADGHQPLGQLTGHAGKVNSICFTSDGRYLLAGTGVSGLGGEAVLWRLADQKVVRRFIGAHDILYSAIISPNGRLVATAGYDKTIRVYDIDTGEELGQFVGHNGAVYDLAFDPASKLICSASADATVKVWRVADGTRLDTRSEPLKEQYTTAISPDGALMVGAGADNRIRAWDLVSRESESINPLRFARFAHEDAIELVRFAHSGAFLVSVGRDGLIKIWNPSDMRQVGQLSKQSAAVAAVAISPSDDAIAVGRMDGTYEVYPWRVESPHALPISNSNEPREDTNASLDVKINANINAINVDELAQGNEQEPNDSIETAQRWTAPFEVAGHIHRSSTNAATNTDLDLFCFHSQQDQAWIVTVQASRDGSPLDSMIEILDENGQTIPRVLLQAVRDSYFTFRGKDSSQTGDFRIQNWQEMSLNQLLYCNGEVVKLFHYPRGPDSGFNVYPNFGDRQTFFDTSALAHPLHEPCYVVEARAPGTKLVPNGLPSFTLNFENDDDSQRELGADSRLTFIAPVDGDYIVRLRDVRGFHGEDFAYKLSVQVPAPRFAIRKVHGENPIVPRGSGRKFGVEIDRIDDFAGPVTVHIDNLPDGLTVSGPLTIEADHLRAWAILEAASDVADLDAEAAKQVVLRATAMIDGKSFEQTALLGEVKLADKPELIVHLDADTNRRGDSLHVSELPVITAVTGQTTTARVKVDRHGYDGRVNFGKEEAAVNLPHGVYVDNTGLNGVLIPEGDTERAFFLTVEPWVEPQERVIFLEAEEAGKSTSNPALLRVVRNE